MKYPTRGNWSLIYYDFQQQCYPPIQDTSTLTQIFPNIHVIKEEFILIVALPVFCFIENLMKYDQNSSPFFPFNSLAVFHMFSPNFILFWISSQIQLVLFIYAYGWGHHLDLGKPTCGYVIQNNHPLVTVNYQ